MISFVLGHLCTLRSSGLLISFLVAISVLGKSNGAYSPSRCIPSERQALLSFKRGLELDDHDHEDSNPLSSWTSNSSQEDCCSWEGMSCDSKTNHVIKLGLRRYHLGSEINPSLLKLKYLKHLDLSFNNFSRIPKFLGSLTRLRYLNLARNPMSGTIPSQLGNLTRLSFLDLSGIHVITVVNFRWISRLSSLKYLTLTAVNFTTNSDWLQSIETTPSLRVLNLQDCHFPEVDTSSLSHINASNTLESILMSYNSIDPRAIPWLLNVSSNLVDLRVHENMIGGPLPNSFGNLTSLAYVDLSGNGFQGEIPKSLGTLCKLKSLFLSCNQLSGTLHNLLESLQVSCTKNSTEILNLNFHNHQSVAPALNELYLNENLLEGPLPNSIGQFPKLHVMNLEKNLLTGPLPTLSHFPSLRALYASKNKLDGSLPESMGQLSNLKVFDVSSNSFSGVVSQAQLMNLSKLKQLDLSFNSFTLNFSSTWVPPFQLTSLNLASCTVGPQFPVWLRTQLILSHIDISNSSVIDVIPTWFSNVTSKLQYLNLSFNHISGIVPNFPLRSIKQKSSSRRSYRSLIVDLSCNQFHGAIPLSLSNAIELYLSNNMFTRFKSFLCTPKDRETVLLDLSNNLLFGRLPDCWLQWRRLVILNLENNNLSGIIPGSIGSLYGLQTLRLRHNSLSGILPSSLNRSSGLLLLDLGDNNLNGKIPTWVGESLKKLMLLSLKSNKFYGRIPPNLCHLHSIQILDLSLNNLSGVIPSCIDNFTSMVHNRDDNDKTITNTYSYGGGPARRYENNALVMWKGLEYKYDKILGLLRVIDLSSNRLSGRIPAKVANLLELVQVNLSRNHLSGIIPNEIGELSRLESLDLSHNDLSDKIPMGLAKLSSLAYLDFSYNSLWGKIPTSTQLQSFDASRYAENMGLCGPPLTSTCPGDEIPAVPRNSSNGYVEDHDEEWLDMTWFYAGIGVGFSVGFCGVFGTLVFKTSWRQAYFRFFNSLGDWLYVGITVGKTRLSRRLQSNEYW
ncbi:hypothetical protein FNV43_RR23069 [Rhamnella rubrinervis]|uniref:Leucine-rich repeat-containing N-terminal plant-type domain-containing protein n=1 Tax=Rhamnella rubrinervis TaxID=2594499 RepID=A0A8K0DRB2_9ROSA|nr:hypothetical protein FNV43_RR23069 [Rhamnella rubrinervis]